MTTKVIGLKDFRLNLSSYTKEVDAKHICLIVLNKNKPVFKIFPVTDEEFILENHVQHIKFAREDVKKGRVQTIREVRDELGL